MTTPAISVQQLSKKYKLGTKKKDSLTETVAGWFTRTEQQDEFWALRDVSFEVAPGEAIGIIGKNGAGKSTLLKILCKITYPTAGRIEINGRVSSLLEVGTGFHQELTGRENVFLNGTILGMKRSEIKAKFEEIVAFSGVEQFIDTPVKHYSSGMKVRLAFSVAAHLEPEILIIDEVLAVGDAEFQKKCLGKMEDVTGQGRTVLFVSHNMSAIENLCGKGIYLSSGTVAKTGKISEVLKSYLEQKNNVSSESFVVEIKNLRNEEFDWSVGEYLNLAVTFPSNLPNKDIDFEMAGYNTRGVKLFNCRYRVAPEEAGNQLHIAIRNMGFAPESISFDFGLRLPGEIEYLHLICSSLILAPNTPLNFSDNSVLTIPEMKFEYRPQ